MNLFKHKKKNGDDLKKLLGGYELPSFPVVVMNVLALLRDSSSDINEIAAELNKDPALVVGVFKLVNSAAFSLRTRVTDVKQAVALLGRTRLESVVLAFAVKQAVPEVSEEWFSTKDFWKLSAQKATLAKKIAEVLNPASAISDFTSGMLEDIGIPAIAVGKREHYKKILEKWHNGETDLVDAERKELDFDHQKIGSLMAEKWELPPELTTIISSHHGETKLSPAVKLASMLSDENIEEAIVAIVKTAVDEYGFSKEKIEEIIEEAFEESATLF